MLDVISMGVIAVAGGYLVVLGGGALVMPARAAGFLLGFASTRALHLWELLARVVVGAALVAAAPRLAPSVPFAVLGWVLLGTSACLLVIPWRWHQQFAARSVPLAHRHMGWVGCFSLAGGGVLLAAVLRAWA